MTHSKTAADIEAQIQAIKEALLAIGPMRPGSISLQYSTCSTPNCRCKDKTNPQKHGPYYKLGYVHRGKVKIQCVRREDVPEVQKQLDNYKKFRRLTDEWIALSLEHAQLTSKRSRKK
jgi:hypothetical protein